MHAPEQWLQRAALVPAELDLVDPSRHDRGTYRKAIVCMDTLVSIEVVRPGDVEVCAGRVREAFGWFREVERICTRFDPASELSLLSASSGEPREVSTLLWSALQFAVEVSVTTAGAFDVTVGGRVAARGFDRNYRTGERSSPQPVVGPPCSFRDIVFDEDTQTVTLRRPLVLDLGGVAKGLAIDLASESLAAYPDFAINAGGDILVRGHNDGGRPWRIAIRDPRVAGEDAAVVEIEDAAICTSGDYERTGDGGHHLVDPRNGDNPRDVASMTVVAPSAMLADAFATAAFVLGRAEGLALTQSHGFEALALSPSGEASATPGFWRLLCK